MATLPDATDRPAAQDPRAAEVLDHWIGDACEGTAALERRQRFWFIPDATHDATIRARFQPLVDAARHDRLSHWSEQPADWLALLILLDQFPRNLFRGDSRAYASDAAARAQAEAGIARGFDLLLPPCLRLFCYLPLEHAEDPAAQRRSVALFEALARQAPPGQQRIFATWLDYAQRHAEVIARFGRFPHRNAALGRTDSPAEREYLASPGAGF